MKPQKGLNPPGARLTRAPKVYQHITAAVAATLGYRTELYHRTYRNKDKSAGRCRVNGKCQLWKTRPDDFRLPVKYGLKECFYITPSNGGDWLTEDPTNG